MMTFLSRLAPLVALAAMTAAPHAADARSPLEPPDNAAKAPKQCFYSRNVDSFAAPNENIVNLRVGVRDYYQLEMFAPCYNVDWNQHIALVARGSSWICTGNGLDAEVISHSQIGPQRCAVRAIRKLTPAEVAALPKGAKP